MPIYRGKQVKVNQTLFILDSEQPQ
ncbi:hypothetical protein [Candidatus Coxiella mudrowiae]|nr:hypothetical protein [Candidatus Coxiella mudrowiae]